MTSSQVHYTAGPEGFVAKVNSNEPFLKNGANPSHVMLFVEDPPNNFFDEQQSKSRDQQNDNYNDFEDDEKKNKDQVYRAAANRVRSVDNIYDNNNDQDFGRMKPLLKMFSE